MWLRRGRCRISMVCLDHALCVCVCHAISRIFAAQFKAVPLPPSLLSFLSRTVDNATPPPPPPPPLLHSLSAPLCPPGFEVTYSHRTWQLRTNFERSAVLDAREDKGPVLCSHWNSLDKMPPKVVEARRLWMTHPSPVQSTGRACGKNYPRTTTYLMQVSLRGLNTASLLDAMLGSILNLQLGEPSLSFLPHPRSFSNPFLSY